MTANHGRGTLGPFVKYNGRIGFLTCAHVLFDVFPTKKVDFIHNQQNQHNRVDVCQPAPGSLHPSGSVCGFVQRAIFDPQLPTSVDVAVVNIDDDSRKPLGGRFAMDYSFRFTDLGFPTLPEFNNGSSVRDPADRAVSNMVVLFGSETPITKGILKSWGAQVRSFETVLGQPSTQDKVCMKGQYEVEGIKSILDVFRLGDSGAAVFMLEGTSLHCIGMAIGHTTLGNAVVTPIGTLLDTLSTGGNTCSLATFEAQPMEH